MARVNGADAHASNRIVDAGFVFGSPNFTAKVAIWLYSSSQPLGIEAVVATFPSSVAGFLTSRLIPFILDVVDVVPSPRHVEEHLVGFDILGV